MSEFEHGFLFVRGHSVTLRRGEPEPNGRFFLAP
jgi:hypothetical protein